MYDRFQHMFRSIFGPFFKVLSHLPRTSRRTLIGERTLRIRGGRTRSCWCRRPSRWPGKKREKIIWREASLRTTSSLTRWKAVWQRAELRFLEMHSSVHPTDLGVASAPPAPQKYPLSVAFRWEGEKPCVSIFLRGGSSYFVICDATMTPKK